MEANVDKALRIDEWTAEALTTSAVDDCFFILQKCGKRGLATGSLPAVCAVLGSVNAILAGSFRRHLEDGWKVGPLCVVWVCGRCLGCCMLPADRGQRAAGSRQRAGGQLAPAACAAMTSTRQPVAAGQASRHVRAESDGRQVRAECAGAAVQGVG